MAQNRPILAVVLGAVVLASVVVAAASLRAGTGPEDVALRVDGVEVTFAEYELRTTAALATRPISERFLGGEDFGMPVEMVEQARRVANAFAPLAPELQEAPGRVASVVVDTAAYAAVLAKGYAPSEQAILDRVEIVEQINQTVRTGTDPGLALPRAFQEARIAAIGEERYRNELLPLEARDSLARSFLVEHLDLDAAGAAAMPLILAMEAGLDADLWIHPSLGVTVEEVRAELGRQIGYQRAFLVLSEAWQSDLED